MTPHSLTIADACQRYGFGKTMLYELIAAKKIEAVKLGARTLVLADSVERHIASLPRLGTGYGSSRVQSSPVAAQIAKGAA